MIFCFKVIEKLNRWARPDGWPNAKEERNNAVGDAGPGLDAADADPDAQELYRTVYGVVPWRGRTGAELCGVFFNPFNRGERGNRSYAKDSGVGGWEAIESSAIN